MMFSFIPKGWGKLASGEDVRGMSGGTSVGCPGGRPWGIPEG